MLKEHYSLVSKHFKLNRFSIHNESKGWSLSHEGGMHVDNLYVEDRSVYRWTISDRTGGILFLNLPSEMFANQVLDYIKQTHIMFV